MFEQKDVVPEETVDARKNALAKQAAWDFIRKAGTVHIAKGKKIISFTPDGKNKNEILAAALGRTGNLRAPSLKSGDTVLVGYNDSIYDLI